MNTAMGNAPAIHVWVGRRRDWNAWTVGRAASRAGGRWCFTRMLARALASGKGYARVGGRR